MDRAAALLLIGVALSRTVLADDNTWETWSSPAAPATTPAPVATPAPAEVGWTDWVTTTEYKESIIYDTVTVTLPPVTVTLSVVITEIQGAPPPETVVSTVTITETAVTTETVVTTESQGALPPETVVRTVTTTETETAVTTEIQEAPPPDTVIKTVIETSVITQSAPPPETVVNTDTVYDTDTVFNTATATETAERTITGISVITSLSVATEYVSVSFCPTTLSGLVPCPTRITNTDYTPKKPLPTDYLWGCAPGFLCHPKKVNCNFESNPPADTYICAPEDCLPVTPRPLNDDFLNLEDVNTTCAWLDPVDDYFNINPTFFSLNFNIFKTFGQEECSYTPPPPTCTPPPPPPSSSWSAWTEPSPVSSAPVTSTLVVSVPVSSSAGWGNWQSKRAEDGAHPQVTKRAELVKRQQVLAGPQCYAVCNNACGVYQSIGKNIPKLCDPDGDFIDAMSNVYDCVSRWEDAIGVTTQVPDLAEPLSLCRSYSLSLGANAARRALTTESSAAAVASSALGSASEAAASGSSSLSAASSSASSLVTAAASSADASASAAASSAVSSSATAGAAANKQTNSFLTFILSVLALFVRI